MSDHKQPQRGIRRWNLTAEQPKSRRAKLGAIIVGTIIIAGGLSEFSGLSVRELWPENATRKERLQEIHGDLEADGLAVAASRVVHAAVGEAPAYVVVARRRAGDELRIYQLDTDGDDPDRYTLHGVPARIALVGTTDFDEDGLREVVGTFTPIDRQEFGYVTRLSHRFDPKKFVADAELTQIDSGPGPPDPSVFPFLLAKGPEGLVLEPLLSRPHQAMFLSGGDYEDYGAKPGVQRGRHRGPNDRYYTRNETYLGRGRGSYRRQTDYYVDLEEFAYVAWRNLRVPVAVAGTSPPQALYPLSAVSLVANERVLVGGVVVRPRLELHKVDVNEAGAGDVIEREIARPDLVEVLAWRVQADGDAWQTQACWVAATFHGQQGLVVKAGPSLSKTLRGAWRDHHGRFDCEGYPGPQPVPHHQLRPQKYRRALSVVCAAAALPLGQLQARLDQLNIRTDTTQAAATLLRLAEARLNLAEQIMMVRGPRKWRWTQGVVAGLIQSSGRRLLAAAAAAEADNGKEAARRVRGAAREFRDGREQAQANFGSCGRV